MNTSFVVTLELDPRSFAWLNAWRREHFPAERNHLDAHLTLFHKIEAADVASIERHMRRQSDRDIALAFPGLQFLGRGVAVSVTAPELLRLRSELAGILAMRLTAQDRQPFRPHVTIQNKVAPERARSLFDRLQHGFAMREGYGVAVQIWEYLGGPWRLAYRMPLTHASK